MVNWTVANQGSGDTAVTAWQDNVYIEASSTLDANSILLGSFTHVGLLAAGESYSQSQLVTLPIDLSGPYNLFVVTNRPPHANNPPPVYDPNDANDGSAALPISVGQQLADLQAIVVTAPVSAATGQTVTIDWTVNNNGAAATNANLWYDDVWLSTQPTLQSGGGDIWLGSVAHNNPLAVGDGYSASLTLNLPQNLTAGDYYFIVAVDRPVAVPSHSGTNRVFEGDETNNQTAAAVTGVTLGDASDLVISNVAAPATATSGSEIALSWTVTNNGAATGNVSIADSVYLSLDQVFDPFDDRYIRSVSRTGGLAGARTDTQNADLPVPAGFAGTFYVFVVTNGNGHVFERNTTNNVAVASQAITISLPAPADLVAGTVTIPANAAPGQNIAISYQITNNGANPASGYWYDSLYLSPTPNWSLDDPLLGSVLQVRTVAANGGTYTGTLTAATRRRSRLLLCHRPQQHPQQHSRGHAREQPDASRLPKPPSTCRR